MDVSVACIAGEEVYRQWQSGHIRGNTLPARSTPFGPSAEIFHAEADFGGYYLLPQHGLGLKKTAPFRMNHRANLYALKDLGVSIVLAWSPGAAIRHQIAVGDLVILDDLVDFTRRRPATFYEDGPLGFLRQLPVFCPRLGRTVAQTLGEMGMVHHATGTAAVMEGPRYETPAEVRMLSGMGAHVATHYFAPDAFLTRELELCYAAVCYVVNYAETGSRHRPFATGDLFGGITQRSDAVRLAESVGAMGRVIEAVARKVAESPTDCECHHTLDVYRRRFDLPDDWRGLFDAKSDGK